MKKQLTAILAMAFLLSTFTGCNTAPTSSDSEISDSQPEASSSSKKIYSTSSLTDSFSLPPKVESEPKSEPDIPEMYFPDGTLVDSTGGRYDEYGDLTFDFAFVRYALPIYYSSSDDPYVYYWNAPPITENSSNDLLTTEVKKEYFRVKVGDKLSNGLTVKSAYYQPGKYPYNDQYYVKYDGELTLKGTLILSDEEGIFDLDGTLISSTKGKIYFIPFAEESSNYIISNKMGNFSNDSLDNCFFRCSNPRFVSFSDIGYIYMGLVDEYSEEIKDIFKNGNCIEAVVTLNDLKQYSFFGSGPTFQQSATLVSCELLEGE